MSYPGPPSHTPFQWHDTPATDTPLDAAHLDAAETDLSGYTTQAVNDLAAYADTAYVHQDGTGMPAAVVSAATAGGAVAWATGATFKLNELVSNSGSIYLCTTAHTAGVSFDGTKFQQLNSGGGVASFNTRTGAVSLTKADVTGTGLAALDVSASPALKRTAVKSGPYTLAPGDLVPVDASGGTVLLTLPSAPADGARFAFKIVAQAATPNTVTFATSGSDVFNKAGGSTSLAYAAVNTAVAVQYDAGTLVFTVVSTDSPLATASGAAKLGTDNTVGGSGGSPLNSKVADKSSSSTQAFTGNVTAPAVGATGLTGAANSGRFVGCTTSGAPASGTFSTGDYALDLTAGAVWICTAGGSPGSWANAAAGGTSGVSSFSGRTGAVVPTSGDYAVGQVTGAAPLASPAFTGTPAAPTASAGTSTTQVATTAFVMGAARSFVQSATPTPAAGFGEYVWFVTDGAGGITDIRSGIA